MPIFTEKNITVCQNRFGGKGEVHIEHLLDEQVYNGKVTMYAKITLKPGCSLGYHQHSGNSETYAFLSGSGLYNNNGELVSITAGDTTFTPSGESHAIENTGNDNLIFMALIVSDN
ncbi:MAG TPA: cupin domain-containing protein [Candidatus Avacidaminococcus intestinavium]|uniref:Cupin domain-containing protein n=1 Tax=Candidatus Avacidaminococcus intestinavium TaxID=2840684 RepID=A0A9D1MQW3_9FIRM|nr:cupin domain-containing protein [Candidatus Avacidaminococcus intestinavium]